MRCWFCWASALGGWLGCIRAWRSAWAAASACFSARRSARAASDSLPFICWANFSSALADSSICFCVSAAVGFWLACSAAFFAASAASALR